MPMNPVLKKIGFSATDRVVIFHADDVGMCQASVSAFHELIREGAINSGALMVPCPWFPAVASHCREHPSLDVGVHLTLTSEWESYRWRPISTCDPESGLIDDDGFFFSTTSEVRDRAAAHSIEAEVQAQISAAINAGVDASHIDMHMGALLHADFLPVYLEAGRRNNIPMLAFRMTEEKLEKWNNPKLAAQIMEALAELEEDGFPIFDNFYQTDLHTPEARMEEIGTALKLLPAGLTHFIIHPARDTEELRAITPQWAGRVADYTALSSDNFRNLLKRYGIHTIGYRELRSAMPGRHAGLELEEVT